MQLALQLIELFLSLQELFVVFVIGATSSLQCLQLSLQGLPPLPPSFGQSLPLADRSVLPRALFTSPLQLVVGELFVFLAQECLLGGEVLAQGVQLSRLVGLLLVLGQLCPQAGAELLRRVLFGQQLFTQLLARLQLLPTLLLPVIPFGVEPVGLAPCVLQFEFQ